jgi:glycosyltransferase involved in cell wall biosynthesis
MPTDVVVLADRLPFPPVGGDRLRVYHVCRFLAGQGFRLHLLAFGRSEQDAENARRLEFFETIRLVPLNRTLAAARVFMTFFNRDSMQLRYHYSRAFEAELAELIRRVKPQALLCHLIRMAPYAKPYSNLRRVLEMVDVFSDYYARAKRVAGRRGLLVYSVEEPRIRKAEKEAMRDFDSVVLVAPREKELLEKRYSEFSPKLHVLPNGAPEELLGKAPEKIDRNRITFHGFLGYPPNRDAAVSFVKEVFPKLDGFRLQIIGAEPGPEVRTLAGPNVDVTGPVEAVAPLVSTALASVCPLRTSAGLQNKVLEAMAWGTPVVATEAANAGVQAKEILIAETAQDWVRHLNALRDDPKLRRRLSEAGQRFIRDRFTWSRTLEKYPELLKV